MILGKPKPAIEVSLDIGWFLGLIACCGIFFAGLQRQQQKTSQRGPQAARHRLTAHQGAGS